MRRRRLPAETAVVAVVATAASGGYSDRRCAAGCVGRGQLAATAQASARRWQRLWRSQAAAAGAAQKGAAATDLAGGDHVGSNGGCCCCGLLASFWQCDVGSGSGVEKRAGKGVRDRRLGLTPVRC